MMNSNGDNQSPWNILHCMETCLMYLHLMLVLFSSYSCSDLCPCSDLIIGTCLPLLQFLVSFLIKNVTPCCLLSCLWFINLMVRFLFFFLQFLKMVLSLNNWFLVPIDLLRQPFSSFCNIFSQVTVTFVSIDSCQTFPHNV